MALTSSPKARRQGSKEEKSSKKGWGSEKGAKGIKKSAKSSRQSATSPRQCTKSRHAKGWKHGGSWTQGGSWKGAKTWKTEGKRSDWKVAGWKGAPEVSSAGNLDRRRPLADLIDYARSCSKALDGLSGQEEQLMSTRALEEMGERLLLVAADQRGSKPLEKLIKKAASEGFLAAFKRLLDDLDNLAPNQYASHVLETALKSWAERLGQEKDPEFFKPIVATCNKVQEEGSWDSLMNSPCSAHVVRGLLMALGGYAPETDKEKAARAGLLPQTKHEVPPEVVECRRQTAASLIKLIRLDSSLCLSSHASPVLQLLLRLLRDCHDRALLAEACAAVVGAKAVTGPPCLERCDALRRSAPGSRVLEAVLETSGAELFGELFARFFRPRLSELAMAEFGPFLVQKLADGLREPPQLQLALGELDFVALLGSGQNAQHAVVLKMLEAALRLRAGLKAAAGNVFRALALQNASEHPKAWPTLLALQSLEVDDLLEKDSKEKDSKQKESKSKERKASDAEGRLRRLPAAGPTILAVLLRFPADTVAPITAGLSKMLRPQLLLAMAQEAKTARVLEAALAPSSALENRRLKLAAAFKGLLGQLGPHHVGGWVCAALWRAARSQESLREAFAQELLAVEAELRQRNFAVWKVCGLNQVKLRSEEWVQQQKKAGKVQALFGPLLGDEEAAKALEAQRARAAEDEAQRQVALDPTVAALLPYEPESPTGEAEAPAPAQNPKATQDESLQQTLQLIKTKAGVKRKRPTRPRKTESSHPIRNVYKLEENFRGIKRRPCSFDSGRSLGALALCGTPKLWLRDKGQPRAAQLAAQTRFLPMSTLTQSNQTEEEYLDRWSDGFLERNWPLALIMALEILVVGGLYLYHIAWVRVQRQRAKDSAVMRLTEALSLEMLRRFLPGARVEKYRFRGMGRKKAMASISFEDISLQLPSGEQILSGVSGEFRAGRMCAIMGPSGAGKTSLMNVLCGKAAYATATGTVRFNGQEGEYADYKTVMGFVPQEDVVHEGLTVGEQIRFSADLRNAYDTEAETRKRICEDVLKVMQLDGLQNSIVGGLEHRGISGGQRKRVSIGLELAADPTMLFLDEPTSGLDAASSLQIVQSLKRMGQLGMTSVMVVHQPRYSLFSLFDDVLLLGKGGRTVYFGPPSSARECLGFLMPLSENPADWFMDLIAGEVPNVRIPQFVPDMLFDIWELNKDRVERTQREEEQALIEVNEWEELVKKLGEEWPRISYRNAPSAMDPRREGVLREEDLLRLLKNSLEEDEEAEDDIRQAFRELLKRIAGPHASVASRKEVLEFLASLQGVVASDKDLKTVKKKAANPKPTLLRSSPAVSPREEIKEEASPASKAQERRASGRRMPTMIPEEEDNKDSARDTLAAGLARSVRAEAAHRAPAAPAYPELECLTPRPFQPEGDRFDYVPTMVTVPSVEEAETGEETSRRPSIPFKLVVESVDVDEVEDARAGPTLHAVGSSASMATAATSILEKARRPEEFVVSLDRGTVLGADFSLKVDRLSVKQVAPSGRVADWNAANPGLKLKKGDEVTQVNGISTPQEMFQELLKDDLQLTVQPRKHKRSSRVEDGSFPASPSSGMKEVPRLNLQRAQAQAAVVGPRGLHASLSEELKVLASPSMKSRRRSKASSDGEGSSSNLSEYSSAAGDEASRGALFPSPRVEESTLKKLSPRTRSVWSRRLVEQTDLPPKGTGGKRVALADDASWSEFTISGKPSDENLESEASRFRTNAKATFHTTKSFTSAANLRKHASNSKPPGFLRQLAMLLHRSSIQWWRHTFHRGLFLFVISGSSAILGLMDAFVVEENEWQVLPFLNLHTTLALLSCVFCLNVFSTDRPVFWRERESGLNIAAFFVSKIIMNTVDVILQCFLLAAIYYMIRQPDVSFAVYFVPFLLVSFASSGLGYAISTVFPAVHGPFIAAIVIFVICGLLGHPLRVETMSDGGCLEDAFSDFCWWLEILWLQELESKIAPWYMERNPNCLISSHTHL
ncbi:unnamed protein product [Effrenium voratum]|nr:unnamed protein product [Effrenium voratum]